MIQENNRTVIFVARCTFESTGSPHVGEDGGKSVPVVGWHEPKKWQNTRLVTGA